MMQTQGKGAVLVADNNGLAGIFTERDVSLRVVAAGLDPQTTVLKQVMTANPVTIDTSDTPLQALATMHAGNFRHLPIMKDESLVDIISLRDIYMGANTQLVHEIDQLGSDLNLGETVLSRVVGSQRLVTFGLGTTVLEAAKKMAERDIGSVLIVELDELIGIFTERDVSLRVVATGLDPQTTTLSQVLTPNPTTIAPNQVCSDILDIMRAGGFRHLPVIDQGQAIGVISIRDIYAAVLQDLENDFGKAMRERAKTMLLAS